MTKPRTFALNDGFGDDFRVCLPLAQLQSVEQPAKLATGDNDRSNAIGRPLKRTVFKTTVEQPEAVVFPVQDFELVALAVAEHEKARRERVKTEAFLNESGQRVDGLTQIGGTASKIDALDSG